MANPLLGAFGGHIVEGGGAGSYAHNALSAWVSYGFFGFLMYLSLTSIAFFVSAYSFVVKQKISPCWVLAFSVNFVCILIIFIAQPVFWPLPTLGWGVFTNALIQSKGIMQAQ